MFAGILIFFLATYSYLSSLPIIGLIATFLAMLIIIRNAQEKLFVLTTLESFINQRSVGLELTNFNKINTKFTNIFLDSLKNLSLKIGNFLDYHNSIKVRENQDEFEKIILDINNKFLIKDFHKQLGCEFVCLVDFSDNNFKIREVASNFELNKQLIEDCEKNLFYLYNSNSNSKSYVVDNVACNIFSRFKISQIFRFDIYWSASRGIRQSFLWVMCRKDSIASIEQLMSAKDKSNELRQILEEENRLNKLKKKVVNSRSSSYQKNKLLAGLSHDLRSPINNLNAILECLKLEFDKDSEEVNLIGLGKTNLKNLNNLVENILDISKFKAGQIQLKIETAEINPIIREILESFKFDADLKNLKLNFKTFSEKTYCDIDIIQFKRIITNLLSNAIKYTQEGSVEIEIKEQNNTIHISVRDTGIGLSKDQIEKIFTPFTRFSDSEIKGVGIGLSVTKLLVSQHKGTIDIISELGKGTEFIVNLPVKASLKTNVNLDLKSKDIQLKNIEFIASKNKSNNKEAIIEASI